MRTGDADVDSLIAILEAGNVDGLIDAFAETTVPISECNGLIGESDAAFVETWARDTVARGTSLSNVASVPEGYPIYAEHALEIVLEETPLYWRATSVLESGGEIVGLIASENCYRDLNPGQRAYLLPPLEPDLVQFDSSRRTGVAVVDALLDAMQSGNEATWEGLVVYQEVPCGVVEYGPGCPDGAAPGTMIDAFPSSACHGGYTTVDRPPRVEIGGADNLQLYAVTETAYDDTPDEANIATIVLFRPDGGGVAVSVGEEGMTSIRQGCGPWHPEWLTPQGPPDYVLPPPK
jgi:hypothetical protein